jgi:hypothetical protein
MPPRTPCSRERVSSFETSEWRPDLLLSAGPRHRRPTRSSTQYFRASDARDTSVLQYPRQLAASSSSANALSSSSSCLWVSLEASPFKTRLCRLLADPNLGKLLRSRLSVLELPMLDAAETRTPHRNDVSVSTDGVFNCSAKIRFQGQEQSPQRSPQRSLQQSEEQEKSVCRREISLVGYLFPNDGISYGTPHRIARDFVRTVGVEPRRIVSLTLSGRRSSRNQRDLPLQNSFWSFGLDFPNDPLCLTELALVDFDLRQLPASTYA